MISIESRIHKYIDEKKELQKLVHQIIENPFDDNDTDFQNLLIFLNTHQYKENKVEIEHFLHLVLIISINHNRQPDFFKKIEKILIITSEIYKPHFSNQELFIFFQRSRPILLILLKAQIIKIDEIIFKQLIKFTQSIENEISNYFYPEIIQLIKSGTFEHISAQNLPFDMNADTELFESNRQKGENESILCSIIREDKIDDFIPYIHKTNISLSSRIRRSIFETNSMLIENPPTLIEYAAFFGSIRIIKYLLSNNAGLKPSIWLYAVHSNNAEVISIFEEENIEIDDKAFSEAVICHHNNIAKYIFDNYLDVSDDKPKLSDLSLYSIYSSDNYEFFPYEIDGYDVFCDLCKSANYSELVDLYLELKKEEIEDFVNQRKSLNNKEIIDQALEIDRIDIVYHLLKELNEIPSEYFKSNTKIKKIALPPTIKSISDNAFRECVSLIDVSIPSSVTTIGSNAFCLCTALNQVIIPSSVTTIEDNAFYFCQRLSYVNIPSSVVTIGKSVFNATHLFKVNFDFPSSLLSADNFAFSCAALAEIELPYSLQIINSNCFGICSSLTYISIPSSVEMIGSGAFASCSQLREITIPPSIKAINSSTFADCSSLTKITLPSSLNYFGSGVFSGCQILDKIVINDQCDEVRIQFYDDKFLVFKSDPESEVFDTLLWAKPSLTAATVPPFITKIYNWAFNKCELLTQVEIPSSVTSLEEQCFAFCTALTNITIPSSVVSIGNSAFLFCTALTSITIPSSVTTICFNAFSSCSQLAQVTFELPSSVTSIGYAAFAALTSLTQISIPKNVTSIEYSLFNGCTALTHVDIPDTVTTIEHSAFSVCTALTQIDIPSSVTVIGNDAFHGCTALTQINLPSSVTEIGDSTFCECSALTMISIPSSVVKIGERAFMSCTALIQVTFEDPSSLTSIGKSAFHACISLTHIEIPSSVTSMGDYALSFCLKLNQISIPRAITNKNLLGINENAIVTEI